jgi:hypothetical protein
VAEPAVVDYAPAVIRHSVARAVCKPTGVVAQTVPRPFGVARRITRRVRCRARYVSGVVRHSVRVPTDVPRTSGSRHNADQSRSR